MIEVGNTPLVEIEEGIFAKIESGNPWGSVKDRMAVYVLNKSRELGLLKPGQMIVEATSGNTGIALANYAMLLGNPITVVMPNNMSEERKSSIEKTGAKLILCDAGDFVGAAKKRDGLAEKNGWFNTKQFSNELNVECHFKTTGQEILRDIKPDAFVAGVGTGGSWAGIGKALIEDNPAVHLGVIEPEESAAISGGKIGGHKIQGIGDGFIPEIVKRRLSEIDKVYVISEKDAEKAAQELISKGHCVGISSGAALLAAREARAGGFKKVVTIFPDGCERYGSMGLMPCEKHRT